MKGEPRLWGGGVFSSKATKSIDLSPPRVFLLLRHPRVPDVGGDRRGNILRSLAFSKAQPCLSPATSLLVDWSVLYSAIVKQTDVGFAWMPGTPRLREGSLSVVATPKSPSSLCRALPLHSASLNPRKGSQWRKQESRPECNRRNAFKFKPLQGVIFRTSRQIPTWLSQQLAPFYPAEILRYLPSRF